ncbi:hypothetical protein N7G274_010496 [Stereocaulon virgatum]|uniref:F-box domain-containing protein n=1 Tax=Stereocaulon virgatum TaxID=373712 RepID=A0ABR3ZTG2_9LECA
MADQLSPPAEHYASNDVHNNKDDNGDGDAEEDTDLSHGLSPPDHSEGTQASSAEHEELIENLQAQADLRRMIAKERNKNARCEYEEALVMLETQAKRLNERVTRSLEVPSPSTSQRPTYGSNGDVYNPYDPYSSRQHVAQENAAGRMSSLAEASVAQRGNIPLPTGQGMHNGNHLADMSQPLGETKIALCARILVRGGEMRGEDLDKILSLGNNNDITLLRKFVDTARFDNFVNSSSYDPRGIEHPLVQYTIHRSGINSVPGLGIVPPPASSTVDQARYSLWAGDDQRLYLPDASLGTPSDPGVIGSQGSEHQRCSLYDQPSRLTNGTRFMKPHKTNCLQQVGTMGGELPHNSTSSLTGTPSQVSLSSTSDCELDGKIDRKRRRTGASPSDAIPSPLLQGGRLQLPQAPSRRTNTSASGLRGVPSRQQSHHDPGKFAPRARSSPLVTASSQGVIMAQAIERLPDTVRTIIYNYLGLPTRTTTSTLHSMETLLPPLHHAFRPYVLFTTELFPRNYNAAKRLALTRVLRTNAPYTVPVAVTTLPGKPAIEYYLDPDSQSSMRKTVDIPLGPNGQGWPANCVPLEIFERIIGFLPRDTIETLRYVNREFETKVSNVLFSNVVVPFTPKIYGMLGAEVKPEQSLGVKREDTKGKRKNWTETKEIIADYDSATQEVHDGMATFKAWGPHVRTFGMAFDADQEQLSRPPRKLKLKEVTTFWGQYEWPHPFYNRYTSIEDLEKKADEYRCMSLALSNLRNAQKLGLSVDNGLGWLQGPDMSDRVQLFNEQPKIFGKTNLQLDAKAIEREEDWRTILHSLGLDPPTYIIDRDTIRDGQGPVTRNSRGFYKAIAYTCSQRTSDGFRVNEKRVRMINKGQRVPTGFLVFQGRNLEAADNAASATPNFTIRSFGQGTTESPFKASSLVPCDLTAGQKEWLLETEWAQRAFLSSYCMALVDNSHIFQHVESLIIAKFSSRYLPALQREDFWKALQNLKSLTIKVSADYRDIQKNDSGIVEALDIEPSKAAGLFYNLLTACVATVPGIKTMDLGYYGGGERQTGIFGRNQNVLPAPLTNFSDQHGGLASKILVLPHVEHLTLDNCWIAPPTLKGFVKKMAAHKIHTLTLKSVSLSAHSSAQADWALPNEPNPMANGVLAVANGPPRLFGYRKLGNLWEQRGRARDPSTNSDSWLFTGARIGSWRNVIDAITPGPTVDLLRYAFNYQDDAPRIRDSGALKRINFISCGYVKLVNQPALDQGFLGDVHVTPPAALQKRAMDLMPVMMHRPQDRLLGQIIPALQIEEAEVFHSCFPMKLGWGNDQSKFENYEDGQPIGGSGRFSGHVESLVFKSHSYE